MERTLEATLTQCQAMAGNNIGTSPKQAMTVGAEMQRMRRISETSSA